MRTRNYTSVCHSLSFTSQAIKAAIFGILLIPAAAYAGYIDIVPIPPKLEGSGNGTLNLTMFVDSKNEVDNAAADFDGDNANTDIPSGGSNLSYAESYVTTAGDLQDFYDLNFGRDENGDPLVTEIVIFLDLNETGNGSPENWMEKMDVILNPDSIQGDPDPSGDVLKDQQNAINQVHEGGTVLAELDLGESTYVNLPVNSQGAGFADYALFTGINPYQLDRDDVLVFDQTISFLDNGGETKFLSGRFSGTDILPPLVVAVPSTLLLMGFGALILARHNRRSHTDATLFPA